MRPESALSSPTSSREMTTDRFADQCGGGAGGQAERDAINRLHGTERLSQILDPQHDIAGHARFPSVATTQATRRSPMVCNGGCAAVHRSCRAVHRGANAQPGKASANDGGRPAMGRVGGASGERGRVHQRPATGATDREHLLGSHGPSGVHDVHLVETPRLARDRGDEQHPGAVSLLQLRSRTSTRLGGASSMVGSSASSNLGPVLWPLRSPRCSIPGNDGEPVRRGSRSLIPTASSK